MIYLKIVHLTLFIQIFRNAFSSIFPNLDLARNWKVSKILINTKDRKQKRFFEKNWSESRNMEFKIHSYEMLGY